MIYEAPADFPKPDTAEKVPCDSGGPMFLILWPLARVLSNKRKVFLSCGDSCVEV